MIPLDAKVLSTAKSLDETLFIGRYLIPMAVLRLLAFSDIAEQILILDSCRGLNEVYSHVFSSESYTADEWFFLNNQVRSNILSGNTHNMPF